MAFQDRAGARKPPDVFKTVNTLAFQKNQKDAAPQPVPYGTYLTQAQNVVLDKTAGLKPKDPQLSEIQVQDEMYIHQQMIAYGKAKQARHRVQLGRPNSIRIAGAAGRAGQAQLSLQGTGAISRTIKHNMEDARKVRFTGAGGSSMKPVRHGDAAEPSSQSASASGTRGAAAHSQLHFAPARLMIPNKAAALSLASPSTPDSPGASLSGRAPSNPTSPGNSGSGTTLPMGGARSSTNGAGALLEGWEGPGAGQELPPTTLADKAMQKIRAVAVPGPPPPPPEIPYAEGYKPLTITDNLFERWANGQAGYDVNHVAPPGVAPKVDTGLRKGGNSRGASPSPLHKSAEGPEMLRKSVDSATGALEGGRARRASLSTAAARRTSVPNMSAHAEAGAIVASLRLPAVSKGSRSSMDGKHHMS